MRKRQISGGIVLSFVAEIIATVVGLVYTPIMIRLLGAGEYGLYQLVQSVVNYLNLMNFGFSGAYIRYFSQAKAEKNNEGIRNLNGMFLDVFLVISLLCLCAGTVLYFNIGFLGDKLSPDDYTLARQLLIIMVLNLALSFPNSLFSAYMSANEDFIFGRVLGIILNILVPLLTLPLLYWGKGSIGVVFVTLLLTIVRLAVNIWYCRSRLGMQINFRFFDRIVFRDLMGFTFFIFLSDLVDQLNSNVDKFLLGRMMGTVAVAVYSVGFNLKNYYVGMTWLVPTMYVPEANRLAIEERNDEKLTGLFTYIGRINNYLSLLVISGFLLFGREFIFLWVGSEYDTAYYAALILMVSGYIPAVQTLGVNIQNAKNLHRVRSIVYFVVAVINVIVSVLLIRRWGIVGTCLGTLLATICGHGIFMNWYYHTHIGLDIRFFWKSLIRWIPFAAGLCLLFLMIKKAVPLNGWGMLVLGILIYSACYLFLVYRFGLKMEERESLKLKIKRLLKRQPGEV